MPCAGLTREANVPPSEVLSALPKLVSSVLTRVSAQKVAGGTYSVRYAALTQPLPPLGFWHLHPQVAVNVEDGPGAHDIGGRGGKGSEDWTACSRLLSGYSARPPAATWMTPYGPEGGPGTIPRQWHGRGWHDGGARRDGRQAHGVGVVRQVLWEAAASAWQEEGCGEGRVIRVGVGVPSKESEQPVRAKCKTSS